VGARATLGGVWLPWQASAVLAVIVAISTLLAPHASGAWSSVRPFLRELSFVLVLYSIWQFLGSIGTVREESGFVNGRTVLDIERTFHIANEAAIERWFLPHSWLVQASNGYYAIVHGPALIVFLVWLFVRHRPAYPKVRNTVVWVTGICLGMHFLAVAPPRLYPELGFVDTAKVYGQSVYGTVGQGLSDQMSAMPSVHVAWALIVGFGVVQFSTSRWRWLALLHTVATCIVVVATANHWWLDGIVAALILAAVVLVQRGIGRARRHHDDRSDDRAPAVVGVDDDEQPREPLGLANRS
jgi:hypothetical protein